MRTISDTEKALLESAAKDLLEKMDEQKDTLKMSQHGFDTIEPGGFKTMQVHVTVTRDEDEFIEPFTTVVTRKYSPKKP